MRRTRLIWFAAGAATVALSSVLAGAIVSEDKNEGPFLMVEDDLSSLSEMEDPSEIVTLSGKMLRECGVARFEIVAPFPDGGGYALVPIDNENAKSLDCVFERSQRDGFILDVWMKRHPNA